MKIPASTNAEALRRLQRREPCLWINPGWDPAREGLPKLPLGREAMHDAEARWQRFAPLLAELFPELREAGGIIESALTPVPDYHLELNRWLGRSLPGRLFVKGDHALPVAGSIKARGGIYEVLVFAERLALEQGLLPDEHQDYHVLGSPAARMLFGQFDLSVGSTGNLGLSIGIMGKALGFRVTVHMSVEAKAWKKARLRARGVKVVEHASDYTAACAVARREAAQNPRIHFVDDENSRDLFLGYSVAVLRLQRQLANLGIAVDERHPLFLYLPCGVGGAPGGITFGARHVFGDHAHCFFAEPVEAPCMLLGLLTGRHARSSVYDVGLKLQTDADGLAVAVPSRFVGELMVPLVSGCYTVTDRQMYRDLAALYATQGLEIEPSSAAACAGPPLICTTSEGQAYQEAHALGPHMAQATHILWTTGGLFVPPEQHAAYRAIAAGTDPDVRAGAVKNAP